MTGKTDEHVSDEKVVEIEMERLPKKERTATDGRCN